MPHWLWERSRGISSEDQCSAISTKYKIYQTIEKTIQWNFHRLIGSGICSSMKKNRSSYNSNHSWTSRGCTNKYTINEVLPGPSNSHILGDLATMRQGTKELFTSVNGPLILLWSNSSTLGSHGTGMFSWWSSWRSCTRNAHDTSLSCLA